MAIVEIVESKRWIHTNGDTASIYGAVPWTTDNDRPNWQIEVVGYTWRCDDGTVGLGRKPAQSYSEALEIANKINARQGSPLIG